MHIQSIRICIFCTDSNSLEQFWNCRKSRESLLNLTAFFLFFHKPISRVFAALGDLSPSLAARLVVLEFVRGLILSRSQFGFDEILEITVRTLMLGLMSLCWRLG